MEIAQTKSPEVRRHRRSSLAERSKDLKKAEESENEGDTLVYKGNSCTFNSPLWMSKRPILGPLMCILKNHLELYSYLYPLFEIEPE